MPDLDFVYDIVLLWICKQKSKDSPACEKEFIMKPHNKPNENFNDSLFKHYIRGQKSSWDEAVALLMCKIMETSAKFMYMENMRIFWNIYVDILGY